MNKQIITLNEASNYLHQAITKAKEEYLYHVFSELNIDVPKYIEDDTYRLELEKQGLTITDSNAGGINYIEIIYKGITSFCLFEIQIVDTTISVNKKEFNKVEKVKK